MSAAATLAGCAVLTAGAPAPAAPGTGKSWLVYVTNNGSDSVSVIDTATRAVVATVPVGRAPTTVAISPDSTTAYVTNDADGTVTVIDTFTTAVARTTTAGTNGTGTGSGSGTGAVAGSRPAAATTPDGATRFVVDTAGDRVDVVATATGAVVATISGVGDAPGALAISPDGSTVYVANAGSGTVSLIDTASHSVLDVVAVGLRPSGVAVTPDQAPAAALTITPAPAGQLTTLDASDASVRFGTIATYAWDFGDGTTATTTVPTTTYAYAHPGRYTVTLTLTSAGGTSTALVRSGPTVIRNGGPQARVARAVTIPTVLGGGLPITGPAVRPAAVVGLLATALGAVLVLLCQWVSQHKPAVPARRRCTDR